MTEPTVTDLLVPLAEIEDRGVYFEDTFTSWREHLRDGAALAAALRARFDPARPPHVGVLLENTPSFSAALVAAGLSGIVPVGLNAVRRGAALIRDIRHADCQLVLADANSAAALGDTEYIDVDSAEWAEEVAAYRDAEFRFQSASAADLFMLIFTSGTSGEPKAVKITHRKVASAGLGMAMRFGLDADDVCYVSMPLFHSNAVLVGWAVAAACRGSMALRRKFSASGFLPDVRRYGATYANYVGKPLSYVLATPSSPTTPTIRCARSTATRAFPATSSASPAASVAGCRTASVPPSWGWPSPGYPALRRGRWGRCPTGWRSCIPKPDSPARRVWSANW